jgi:hypothetical protein
MVFFLSLIFIGFLYLWRFGYLDWVRAAPGPEGRRAAGQSSKDKGESVHHGTH